MKIAQIEGVIFDVDDTLLDNHAQPSGVGLHEESRLKAVYEVGRRHGSQGLLGLTQRQSLQAFLDAPVHTLQAAVWNMLVMAGEAASSEIEPGHPLLNEIMELKEELHEEVLRTLGQEVPGASSFVRKLAAHGLSGRMAIASTANRRDIRMFLEMTELAEHFPEEHIVSREQFQHPKPHPEAFDRAFATLGLPEADRERVLAVEDDPRGVMSAKAAGLYTCAITTRFEKRALQGLAVPPDLVVESFAELEKVLALS